MITEVGALVSIIKNLLDSTKTGRELWGVGNKKLTIDSITKTQGRLSGISEQMFQSMALYKMMPIWLKEHAQFDLFDNTLSNEDVTKLDTKLRGLIFDSNHDHFKATFFHTSFSVLPGVDDGIKQFGDKLKALEDQLNGIPAGDATSWRRTWPILKMRMHDLRVEAVNLMVRVDEIQTALIMELRDAAGAR